MYLASCMCTGYQYSVDSVPLQNRPLTTSTHPIGTTFAEIDVVSVALAYEEDPFFSCPVAEQADITKLRKL